MSSSKARAGIAAGPPVPWLSAKDLAVAGQIAAGAAITWLLPERSWRWVPEARARTRLRLPGRWRAAQRARLRRFLDPAQTRRPIDEIIAGYMGNRQLAKLQPLRCHHPRDWSPPVRLEGRCHIDAALAAGRGAILWVAPFVFGPLLAKMTWQRAGLHVTHLSRYSHGYSQSLVGARLLNPIWTRAEDRFLAERITLGPDGATVRQVRTLANRLRANLLVSVSVGARGARALRVPFLNDHISVATGVPSTAAATGAAILPVVTLREQDGVFVTWVGAPLAQAAPHDGIPAMTATIADLARRLEPFVCRSPDQFWWHYDIIQ